jgi:hypothetical protein
MNSPYADLPAGAFWRTGVVDQRPGAIENLYQKKFAIEKATRTAAAGSCFAQHISRHLRERGFAVLDMEPPPIGLAGEAAANFGYGLYSARYGNIYTSRQLLQLAQEAFGEFTPVDAIWQKEGRYYDALRPSVEPTGLSSPEHVRDHRRHHLGKVRELILTADLFVFTLGLTEAWIHAPSGTIYPTAPGTIAGQYDANVHRFQNLGFMDVYSDLTAFFELANSKNGNLRFLLTVSPVPLTATASGDHVLAATIYSKSVLRAVAGQLAQERENVDYFPSYEIITSSLAAGQYFEPNLRSVRPEGVAAAMRAFFAQHDISPAAQQNGSHKKKAKSPKSGASKDDVVCEDVLLDAFAP